MTIALLGFMIIYNIAGSVASDICNFAISIPKNNIGIEPGGVVTTISPIAQLNSTRCSVVLRGDPSFQISVIVLNYNVSGRYITGVCYPTFFCIYEYLIDNSVKKKCFCSGKRISGLYHAQSSDVNLLFFGKKNEVDLGSVLVYFDQSIPGCGGFLDERSNGYELTLPPHAKGKPCRCSWKFQNKENSKVTLFFVRFQLSGTHGYCEKAMEFVTLDHLSSTGKVSHFTYMCGYRSNSAFQLFLNAAMSLQLTYSAKVYQKTSTLQVFAYISSSDCTRTLYRSHEIYQHNMLHSSSTKSCLWVWHHYAKYFTFVLLEKVSISDNTNPQILELLILDQTTNDLVKKKLLRDVYTEDAKMIFRTQNTFGLYLNATTAPFSITFTMSYFKTSKVCGGVTLINHGERISVGSPKDPLHNVVHPTHIKCTWYFITRESSIKDRSYGGLALTFDFVILTSTTCVEDYLELFDGNLTNSDKRVKRFCKRPLETFKLSKRFRLDFVTTSNIPGIGFRFTVTTWDFTPSPTTALLPTQTTQSTITSALPTSTVSPTSRVTSASTVSSSAVSSTSIVSSTSKVTSTVTSTKRPNTTERSIYSSETTIWEKGKKSVKFPYYAGLAIGATVIVCAALLIFFIHRKSKIKSRRDVGAKFVKGSESTHGSSMCEVNSGNSNLNKTKSFSEGGDSIYEDPGEAQNGSMTSQKYKRKISREKMKYDTLHEDGITGVSSRLESENPVYTGKRNEYVDMHLFKTSKQQVDSTNGGKENPMYSSEPDHYEDVTSMESRGHCENTGENPLYLTSGHAHYSSGMENENPVYGNEQGEKDKTVERNSGEFVNWGPNQRQRQDSVNVMENALYSNGNVSGASGQFENENPVYGTDDSHQSNDEFYHTPAKSDKTAMEYLYIDSGKPASEKNELYEDASNVEDYTYIGNNDIDEYTYITPNVPTGNNCLTHDAENALYEGEI